MPEPTEFPLRSGFGSSRLKERTYILFMCPNRLVSSMIQAMDLTRALGQSGFDSRLIVEESGNISLPAGGGETHEVTRLII